MIGIFDSGSGGLTVLRELRRRAPEADIVYFGDLKNAPYGNKSREELGALTVLGIQKLIDAGATEIISACNSVSVSIVLPMFEILELPKTNIIEMVGPTVSSFRGKAARPLVVATRATIESGVYQSGFHALGIEAVGIAIPTLVDHIESGADEGVMRTVVEDALAPVSLSEYTHMVLGCTHYPLIRNVFEDIVHVDAAGIEFVDPAEPVVNAALQRFDVHGSGTVSMQTSAESDVFAHFAAEALKGA